MFRMIERQGGVEIIKVTNLKGALSFYGVRKEGETPFHTTTQSLKEARIAGGFKYIGKPMS